jgi:hypothetical protein
MSKFEKKEIILTIGIPSLPDRMFTHFNPLYEKLKKQIGDSKDIEVLSIMDNKAMSVGRKRTLLFKIAQGKYTCIIDDDDDVTDDFIETLRSAITNDLNVDVICYNQDAEINGKSWLIKTSLKNSSGFPFDQLQVDQFGNTIPCMRPPWHWCAWNTEFAKNIPFGDTNYQEDTVFVVQAISSAKTELVIDKVLCKYRWIESVSQAQFQPGSHESISKVVI